MTLTLDLPVDVEEALAEEAQRLGVSPAQIVTEGLRVRYDRASPPADSFQEDRPRTGAELLEIMAREGLFVNREGQPDSPELARQIREEAWRRA